MTQNDKQNQQHTGKSQFIKETVPVSSRRRLLSVLAAGSVLAVKSVPETWMRPVVQSVMLPAHAQTSPTDNEVPTSSPTVFFTGRCEDAADDDQFYLVEFSDQPAEPGGSFTITSLSSDPGLPTGDNVVYFARHSAGDLTFVTQRSSIGTGTWSPVNPCDNPTSQIISSFASSLESGNAHLQYSVQYGGSPGEPTMELFDFALIEP